MNQYNPIQRLTKLAFAFLFIFSISLTAQDAAKGEKLFKSNCAACHKLKGKLLGPELKGIGEKRDTKWLHSWIKDSQALIKSGDELAIKVFEENNKIPMTAFKQLSNEDIDDILAYTDGAGKSEKKANGDVASSGDDAKIAEGKKLFKQHCTACHKLEGKLLGPELKGIGEKRDTKWLHSWIKDSQALIKSGDELAIKVFEENNKIPMTAFKQLKDSEIDAMLAYFKVGDVEKKVVTDVKKEEVKVVTDVIEEESTTNWTNWLVIALVVGLLALAFLSKIKFLKYVSIIFLLLIGAYVTFDSLLAIGIDQGYEPIQPIAFSHKIHAGDNKIDCEYCHSSAKHSKTSGIPTANVCMNCHKSIGEVAEDTRKGNMGKKELDLEIQKIYAATGWDPESFQYKDNYKGKPLKPIEWVRVHNLPDFAYYNHSQHVSVAGIECQTCHGPVEEMDDMRQHAPLTMNWCIDCHQEREVNMDNKYYTEIHKELKGKGVDKATIAELGGKECGKCHY